MKSQRKAKVDLKKLVGMAMFSALAYAATLVFRIPVQFLTFDAKDAVLTVASFIYGPLASIPMSLIPALIEFITISDTGIWGLIMNFVSSATFAFFASTVYKYKRSLNGAMLGLFASISATVGVMIIMNMFITPIYLGVPKEAVMELLPILLLPFNFAKALMNSALVMLIYKPITLAMRRAGLISGRLDMRFNRQSVITLAVGGVTLILAIALFIIIM
jgi:riboflavin transporter FmnP